jgi:hypothetical protein
VRSVGCHVSGVSSPGRVRHSDSQPPSTGYICFFPLDRAVGFPARQPGGNVSAAPPVAPPCDPRASPLPGPPHLVDGPPRTGMHHGHGQGGDKSAHFGR